MTEEEPKHPYVTRNNAKVHLIFSIILVVLSVIQLILGIVCSEISVKIPRDARRYRYSYYYINDLFWANGIWPAFLGVILAACGFSVFRTRSRSNGIMTSVMLHIAGWVAYPVAIGLNVGFVYDYNYRGINDVRYATTAFEAISMLVTWIYAFYASFHTCCNSNVRKENRMVINNQTVSIQQQQVMQTVGGQQQVILVPAGQQPMATYYVPQGMPAQPIAYAQQPPAYSGPPPVIAQQQIPVQVVHQVQLPQQNPVGGGQEDEQLLTL